jgi:hypothetical protein
MMTPIFRATGAVHNMQDRWDRGGDAHSDCSYATPHITLWDGLAAGPRGTNWPVLVFGQSGQKLKAMSAVVPQNGDRIRRDTKPGWQMNGFRVNPRKWPASPRQHYPFYRPLSWQIPPSRKAAASTYSNRLPMSSRQAWQFRQRAKPL